MLLLTYIVPQFLYRRTSGQWFVPLVGVTRAFVFVVRPLTAFLDFLQSLAQLGEADQEKEEPNTQQENIEALITAGTEEGIIEEDDRRLIHSVVAFGNKTVREVMTPRPDMVAVSADATLEDLRQLVIHEQFSRIPVYEETSTRSLDSSMCAICSNSTTRNASQHSVRDLVRPIRLRS